MDDRPVEDAPDHLRRSRDLAVAAMLAVLTAAWLPWWVLEQASGGTTSSRFAVNLFARSEVTTFMPIVTGIIVVLAALLLFVRIAGRSIIYEPDTWRRDLVVVGGAWGLALLSVIVWPLREFGFWGGRRLGNETVQVVVEQTWMPGLGFWLGIIALVLVAVAAWFARSGDSPTP